MRAKTNLFKINGVAMLAPDEEVAVNYEDLDSSDSGRDESGVMHRSVVRFKVGSWKFEYSHLTEEERKYMESLFPNAATFQFTHPTRADATGRKRLCATVANSESVGKMQGLVCGADTAFPSLSARR